MPRELTHLQLTFAEQRVLVALVRHKSDLVRYTSLPFSVNSWPQYVSRLRAAFREAGCGWVIDHLKVQQGYVLRPKNGVSDVGLGARPNGKEVG